SPAADIRSSLRSSVWTRATFLERGGGCGGGSAWGMAAPRFADPSIGSTHYARVSHPNGKYRNFHAADRICNGNVTPSKQSINEWFDLSCFVKPPIYQFGDSGRNIIIGPGLETYDFSLTKDFLLTEKMGLTFRSEFFNIFNHANFGLPDRKIGTSTSGTINSVVTNARQIQFGLRLHF